MKVLCPSCQTSIELAGTEAVLECESCGFSVDISKLGTSPGTMPTPVIRDFTGDTLGDYELLEMVGIGGMGVVYKAVSKSNGAVVAVKILNYEFQWNQEAFIARFKREAEALKRLNHQNVVRLIDSGQEGDCYYLVTEYVEGQNLAGYLRSETLTIDRVVEIMAQVCEAITYAHSCGIVHRDIKPANIIVGDNGVKVLDFGLAQITGKDAQLSTLTRTDVAMGTINYLSPEQRLSAKNVDERSDIFSLGIVFFEMLTGTLPMGSFDPPSKFRKDAGKKCNQIVSRSLNSNPDMRYQNVESLRVDLLKLVRPPALSRPLALAAIAVVAVIGGGVAAWPYIGGPVPLTIEPSDILLMSNEPKDQSKDQAKDQARDQLEDQAEQQANIKQTKGNTDGVVPQQQVVKPVEINPPAEQVKEPQIKEPPKKPRTTNRGKDNTSGKKVSKPSKRRSGESKKDYMERRRLENYLKKMGKEVEPSVAPQPAVESEAVTEEAVAEDAPEVASEEAAEDDAPAPAAPVTNEDNSQVPETKKSKKKGSDPKDAANQFSL